MPDDLALADELDALSEAALHFRELALERRVGGLPGNANYFDGLADRLERLRARLEADPPT